MDIEKICKDFTNARLAGSEPFTAGVNAGLIMALSIIRDNATDDADKGFCILAQEKIKSEAKSWKKPQ